MIDDDNRMEEILSSPHFSSSLFADKGGCVRLPFL